MSTPTPLKVAITGGGLAGATKHTHLQVRLYEASPQFSERGAGVGIAVNGTRALSEMGPDARGALDRAGAVAMNTSRLMLGSGENAGNMLYDYESTEPELIVHRAAFLQELLAPIPESVKKASKKLVSIQEGTDEGAIILTFADGSVEQADVLIGADGIHGQYGWLGEGGFLMHDVLDNGDTVQCVAAMYAKKGEWKEGEWKKPLDRKRLEEVLEKWLDGPIAKGMIDCLSTNAEQIAFAQYHHSPAPAYAKGRVCIMGDAAHAMTPWQGSGAGQAIEDAMILETLLANAQSISQLEAALKAYDSVRRPRTQQVVTSSCETGVIMCGSKPGIGLESEKLLQALGPRWGFIHGLDMKLHKREAVEMMDGLLGKEK